MNLVICEEGGYCGLCLEPLQDCIGFEETDLKTIVCTDCRLKLMHVEAQLTHAKMRKCIQVSGNKPLEQND